MIKGLSTLLLVSVAFISAGCASTGDLVGKPSVSLTDVAVEDIDLKSQTFVLNFEISNPNPFPLPISALSYGVELDGHRFASGEAHCDIVVPASSSGEFEVSVDLNLLKTAPKLLFVVRDGVRKEIPYKLVGRFDLELADSSRVAFTNAGDIQLQAAVY